MNHTEAGRIAKLVGHQKETVVCDFLKEQFGGEYQVDGGNRTTEIICNDLGVVKSWGTGASPRSLAPALQPGLAGREGRRPGLGRPVQRLARRLGGHGVAARGDARAWGVSGLAVCMQVF